MNDADELQLQHAPVTLHVEEQEVMPEQEAAPLLHAPAAPLAFEEEQQQRQVLEVEQNVALNAAAQAQLPAVHANRAAPGAPVQEQAPAKQSYKARQADKRHAKIARKACPVGTAATYDMVTSLQKQATGQDNAKRDYEARVGDAVERSAADTMLLRTFSTGYQVDKKGRPLTKRDAAAKVADAKFYDDYCSNDLERRKPHLERMVDEVLSITFSPDLFSERSLRQNMAQIKLNGEKLAYLETATKDEVNESFFKHLDPARKEALDACFKMYNPYLSALLRSSEKLGVNINQAKYYDHGSMEAIELGQMEADAMQQTYLEAAGPHMQKRKDIEARQALRVRTSAGDYAARMGAGNASLARLKDRMGLTRDDLTSQFVTRSITVLKPGEEHDAENMEILRTVVESGALIKEGKRPTPEQYDQTRDLVAQSVHKVLDCNVDTLASLSDEALLVRAAELNALCMDSMFIDDLMKLEHPTQSWDDNDAPVTLKEHTVGQRSHEYAYKVSVLRGLAERARGLAIQRQLEADPQAVGYCLTEGEQKKIEGGPSLAEYAAKREEIGAQQIEAAKEKYHTVITPGTEEHTAALADAKRMNGLQRRLQGDPFRAVTAEFEEAATPELQQLMKRLHDSHYYSLGHTAAQTKELGMPSDIGEAIFRSFNAFLRTSAARELLTPETLRAMLKDLGAGAGMHNGEWSTIESEETGVLDKNGQAIMRDVERTHPGTPEEELRPAIEQNARSLTQYRRVIRAQFDMFSRKYGNSLESLTVAELMERQDELLQDFADLQVPLDMLTKHPDFLNPNDPDDELLDYRIQYYSLMGKTVSDFIRSFMYLFKSEEHAKSELDFCWKTTKKTNLFSMPDSYLTQHDPTFLHSIDWKEGIRVPQEDVIGAATDAALEYGAAGVAQVLSDLLRGEDNGEAIAQQVSNAVSQAILDNGAEAAPMAAAQATAEALRLLRDKSEPDEK